MQISVILAVLMALWAAESASATSAAGPTAWISELPSGTVAAILTGSTLLVWSVIRIMTRFLYRRLTRSQWPSRSDLRLVGRIDLWLQIMVIGTFALQLTLGGWAGLVGAKWKLQRVVLADELCLVLPFIVMLLIKWYHFYPVNRLVRQYVVSGQLADGLSARPVWSRSQYLLYQLRHSLLVVLAPLLLIIALKDVVELAVARWYGRGEQVSEEIMAISGGVIAVGAGVIFLLAPFLLRRIWKTRRLPDGPLREQLENFCRHLRLRHREILLWDTYSAVANAAVMGLFKPMRYVMLSDALIENMSDEQIEAVFGHEAGHVRHHHIIFLVMFIFASTMLIAQVSAILDYAFNRLAQENIILEQYQWWLKGGYIVAIAAAWLSLFGWISRRFERQADVYGAIAVDSDDSPEANQAEDNNQEVSKDSHNAAATSLLGGRGAAIMASALQRIAILNGISMASRSWRHSSIASRSSFLTYLARQPGALRRFSRQLWAIKLLIILAVLLGAFGWLFWDKVL